MLRIEKGLGKKREVLRKEYSELEGRGFDSRLAYHENLLIGWVFGKDRSPPGNLVGRGVILGETPWKRLAKLATPACTWQ